MNPRFGFRCSVGCLVALIACLWLFASCCGAASSDTFRERFNLPEDPEPLLQSILSTDEFKDQPIQTFLERLREWALELLLRALKWLLDRAPSAGPIRVSEGSLWHVVAALILGALLVFAVIMAIRVLPFKTRPAPKNTRPGTTDIEEVELLSSGDTWDMAIRTAAQADYSEAIVHLFRFVLLWLDEHGQLAFHPSKTNRELLAGVVKNALPRQALAEMIPVFDRVRYGGLQCDQTEYERFLALCRRISGQA